MTGRTELVPHPPAHPAAHAATLAQRSDRGGLQSDCSACGRFLVLARVRRSRVCRRSARDLGDLESWRVLARRSLAECLALPGAVHVAELDDDGLDRALAELVLLDDG
jgi:hypothetical protein